MPSRRSGRTVHHRDIVAAALASLEDELGGRREAAIDALAESQIR